MQSLIIDLQVQNRARIVAEQQLDTKKVTGIGRAVGVEWRATENTPDRKRYEKLAAEDKVRYANEVASYKAQNPVIKKPISAYMFFVQDVRPRLRIENPGLDFSSLGRLLGSTWKNLGVEDKAPFAQKAEADKMRYVAEIAACPEQPMKVSGSSSMAQRIQRISKFFETKKKNQNKQKSNNKSQTTMIQNYVDQY